MSLKNSEIACNSIRKMPTLMMILMGHKSGLQAVGLRSLYWSEYVVLSMAP